MSGIGWKADTVSSIGTCIASANERIATAVAEPVDPKPLNIADRVAYIRDHSKILDVTYNLLK